jgi:UPF0716 family protein affecting phage T7 exclusion
MRKIGCLVFLLVVGLLAVETWFYLKVSAWCGGEYLGCALLVALLSWLGFKVARYHINRLPAAFLSGRAGHQVIGLAGGILIAFPGFLSSALGLLLQIPFMRRPFARLGNAAVASLMRRAMGGTFGGGMFGGGGFTGGFPGMPPGAFPGMPPGAFPGGFPGGKIPDGRGRHPVPGQTPKTYDTTAEKV